VIDRLKANDLWATVNNNDDLIELLRMIRTSLYTGATSKNTMQSLIEARSKFYSFKQTNKMTNAEYLRTFQGLADAVEHLGGDLGVDDEVIRERIRSSGGDPDNGLVWASTKAVIREEYLAMNFFLGAEDKCYGPLLANTQNGFVSGYDKFPKVPTKSYHMLVNYRNPNRSTGSDDRDGGGMSFYQDETEPRRGRGRGGGRGGPGRGRGRGGGRGGGSGGPAAVQPGNDDDNEDDANHAVEEEIGWAANTNNNTVRRYPESSFNVCAAEEFVLEQDGLPREWLLLDSCSTVDIVSNVDLLTDLHPADTPTWVRCNARRVQLTQ
jgi:hypothetical protein